MNKVNRVLEIMCYTCGRWNDVKEWNKITSLKEGENINAEHACDRHDFWFRCPLCCEDTDMEKCYKAGYLRWRQSIGMVNTYVLIPAEAPKAADNSENALVNVLYEQALRQAELLVEIEAALERFDMDEYYKLVEKYREAEQVGARIGN